MILKQNIADSSLIKKVGMWGLYNSPLNRAVCVLSNTNDVADLAVMSFTVHLEASSFNSNIAALLLWVYESE